MPKENYQQMAQPLTNPKIVECDGSHEAMLTRPVELAEAPITASFCTDAKSLKDRQELVDHMKLHKNPDLIIQNC